MQDPKQRRFKCGKRAPRRLMSTPSFGNFLDKATTWPAVAARGWEYALPPGALEMLGNDQYGDCAEAGAMHFIQTETANAGKPLHGTLAQTLALYTALTGFNPNNPATDQGTDLTTVLQYWRDTGISVTDAQGNVVVHKILGWVALDTTNIAQMRYALDVFGGLYLGIQCPQSAEQDTSNWTFKGGPVVGGHCINATGQGAAGGHIQSWGQDIPFTWEFALNYLDEAYCVVSPFWLDQLGKTPSGLDLDGMLAAMKTV